MSLTSKSRSVGKVTTSSARNSTSSTLLALVSLGISFGSPLALAQESKSAAGAAASRASAAAGIARLEQNITNSKENLSQYKSNLVIVQDNLKEVAKAKATVEEQKKEVDGQVRGARNNLQSVDKNEKEIAKLIQTEQASIQSDDLKIQELEKVIAQIKENQIKRQANLNRYREQNDQLAVERREWQARADALTVQQTEVNQRLAKVNGSEKEWRNKRRGYEAEITRWEQEIARHEKTLKEQKALVGAASSLQR